MNQDNSSENERPPIPAPPVTTPRATIDIGRWIRNLVIFMAASYAVVLLLDYHVNYAKAIDISAIRRMVNITREDAIGSWLAVIQTAFVALTLWFVYFAVRRQRGSKWRERGWLLIALFFSYMCFDDGNRFHERIGTAFNDVGATDVAGVNRLYDLFPSYAWQFIFLPFFGAMGLFILYFLWRELRTRKARLLVFLSIAFYVVAVGLDFIEGLGPGHPLNLYTWIADRFYLDHFAWSRFQQTEFDTLRHFSKAIEEVLEMTGTTLLWTVFLDYLGRVSGRIELEFVGFSRG